MVTLVLGVLRLQRHPSRWILAVLRQLKNISFIYSQAAQIMQEICINILFIYMYQLYISSAVAWAVDTGMKRQSYNQNITENNRIKSNDIAQEINLYTLSNLIVTYPYILDDAQFIREYLCAPFAGSSVKVDPCCTKTLKLVI